MTEPAVATKIWPGIPLRDHLLAQVKAEVARMEIRPRLAIVQVGKNPASDAYVQRKLLTCRKVGIAGEHVHLRAEEGETVLHSVVQGLGHDPAVQAIIVQTPLPATWQVQRALDAVPVFKDVDGLCGDNARRRRAGDAAALWPATPLGIMRMLRGMGEDVAGKRVAVIGKGMVVGAPLREILAAAGAEVLGIDKETHAPARLCREAVIVVAAAGAPGLVTREWLRPGAVVVDVGITRVQGSDGKTHLLGDVDRLNVEGAARLLTPVPGGVGPLTVASLFTNIVDAIRLQNAQPKAVWNLDAGG